MVADTYKPKILFSCPEGWLDSPDGCFYFPTDVWAMNWEEAVGYCQELGGYLAEVLNDETQRFLVEQATSLRTSTNWWLGATDQASVSFFCILVSVNQSHTTRFSKSSLFLSFLF